MKQKIRELGYAGLGLGVTVKEKVKKLGHALAKKGKASKERAVLHRVKENMKEPFIIYYIRLV